VVSEFRGWPVGWQTRGFKLANTLLCQERSGSKRSTTDVSAQSISRVLQPYRVRQRAAETAVEGV
jgi:hypothetical protein